MTNHTTAAAVQVRLSSHAIDRWRERVDPYAPIRSAT